MFFKTHQTILFWKCLSIVLEIAFYLFTVFFGKILVIDNYYYYFHANHVRDEVDELFEKNAFYFEKVYFCLIINVELVSTYC